MSLNLELRPSEFVIQNGATEYQLAVEPGDCQIDYFVLADAEVQLYICCGEAVIPLAVGTSVRGHLLVKDAKWLMLKTQKKSTIIAARVFQAPRRLIDVNDRKPVAMHVPTAPPVDLRTMVDRIVGQRLEERGQYQVEITNEDLEDLYPEDVDTEFGPGHVQLEEDEDIYEELARRKAARDAARKGSKGKGGPETPAAGKEPASTSGGGKEEPGKPAETKKD